MSKTSPRENVLAVYGGQRPEAIPLAIYSRYLPRGRQERLARDLGMAIIDWHPLVSLLAPPWHLHSGFLSEVKNAELSISYVWRDEHRVETRTYRTPVGDVSQQTVVDTTFGSDWIERFYVNRSEDYKVLTYLVEHTVFRRQEDAYRAKYADLGDDGVVWGRVDRNPYQKALIELAGPERFLLDLYTNPGPVEELLAAMDRKMDEAFALVLESQAEVIWQPDNLTVDMTPPAAYRRYCLPFYAKHGRQLREAGKRYIIHMDGRLGPLAPAIADATFDVVESFSLRGMGGDMSLSEAMAAWPDKLIVPNFPGALCHQSDQQIETTLDRLLAEAGQTPWMMEISEDIPPGQWRRVAPLAYRVLAAPI